MTRQFTRTIGLALMLTISLIATNGQTPQDKEATKVDKHAITSLRLVDVVSEASKNSTTGVVDPYIIVNLGTPLDTNAASDMAPGNFTIKYLPSGKTVPSSAILPQSGLEGTMVLPGYGDTSFQIELDGRRPEAKPNPGDNQVEVMSQSLHFADKKVKDNVKGAGKIYNESNKKDFRDDVRASAKKAAASAKPSDEKNIFAGLSIAIPSGGSGKTEGNGDIHFNHTFHSNDIALPSLFDQLIFGFHLKKGSENRADPRHFETGLTMRKTFLLVSRKELNKLRNEINGPGSFSILNDSKVDQIQKSLSNLQRGFFRAILFDNAFRFEGDVRGFSVGNISNLLWDSQMQVSTVSQTFAGGTGFFNIRLVPAGLEAGYNLTNDDLKSAEKQSLARVKAGAQFNLHYQAANPSDFLNRVEWEVQGVDRYLFRREAAFDEATKKAIFTQKGNKYWIQSDLKFMFGGAAPFGKAGLKISFNRGSLPPVYAFTKAFTIGLVFQSGDDDNAKEIKLK